MVLIIQRCPRDINHWVGIYIRVLCVLGFIAPVSLWKGTEYVNLGASITLPDGLHFVLLFVAVAMSYLNELIKVIIDFALNALAVREYKVA